MNGVQESLNQLQFALSGGGRLDFEKAGGAGSVAQPCNLNTVEAERPGVQDQPQLPRVGVPAWTT